MALTPGSRLGPYEALSPIGAGGMGEVYRARDTRLNRDVALKILPESFALDAERVARFKREAQVLASLNHANIAAIHGFEESNGTQALVLELVEGPTLADRIAQGPIPFDEALPIAKQMAEALEAAHEQGIVHRDLKPANIKVRPDGTVKVLDFGLAKALTTTGPVPNALLTNSPTITSPVDMTGVGVLLGTAPYMSPEQAKGKTADKRSDIWAYGCVLFEMLTGKRAFDGEDVSETLAAILTKEPDWSQLPRKTSPAVRRLLHRALERDRKRRLADIADARIELEEATAPGAEATSDASANGSRKRLIAWAAGASLAAVLSVPFAGLYFRQPEVFAPPAKLTIELPDISPANSGPSTQLAVSPDGRIVAFTGQTEAGGGIWLRSMDNHVPRSLAGTTNASILFWSPDSQHVAFMAGSKLNRVSVSTGGVQAITDFTRVTGGARGPGESGAWGQDGTILFTPGLGAGLFRVPAGGGEAERVTQLEGNEINHARPEFLSDGSHFLFFVDSGQDASGLYVGGFDGSRKLILRGSNLVGRYVAPDSIVLFREGTLLSQRWDSNQLALFGDVQVIADGIGNTPPAWGRWGVSQTGLLVYWPGGAPPTQLTWIDRTGRQASTVGEPRVHSTMKLSPDGRRVAYGRRDATGTVQNIWVADLVRQVSSRLTFGAAIDSDPTWSPDGTQIAFASIRSGRKSLYVMPSNGGADRTLLASTGPQLSMDAWSPDARFVLYHVATTRELMALPLAGEQKPFAVVTPSVGIVDEPEFSPDGRWVAYNADDSGRHEVYIKAFPPTDGRWQISIAGGVQPRWRADGRELFFLSLDGTMMAVEMGLATGIPSGSQRPLFKTNLAVNAVTDQYAVSPDGKRFLLMRPLGLTPTLSFAAVLNWPSLAQ